MWLGLHRQQMWTKRFKKFFDVSGKHLKTAREYNVKTDSYLQPFGYAGSGTLQLISAKRQGDIFTLGIRIGSVASSNTIDGELKIHLGEGVSNI